MVLKQHMALLHWNIIITKIKKKLLITVKIAKYLQAEEDQEWHHKGEKSHGFWQSESQDSIWEKLWFQWWITGVTDDQATENCSDTGSRSWSKKE